jgi:hypothetical protein
MNDESQKGALYMVLAHLREAWLTNWVEYDYVTLGCSKRGNDVYVSRINRRLHGLGFHLPT